MEKKANSSKHMLYSHVFTFISSIALVLILPSVLAPKDYVEFGVYSSLINFLIPLASFALPSFIIGYYTDFSGHQVVSGSVKVWIAGLLLSSVVLLLIVYLKNLSFTVAFGIYLILIFNTLILAIGAYLRIIKDGNGYFINLVIPKFLLIIFVLSISDITSDLLLMYWGFSLILTLLLLFPKCIMIIRDEFKRSGEYKDTEISMSNIILFCFPIAMSNITIMAIPLVERLYLTNIVTSESLAAYIFTIDFMMKISAIILVILKVVVYPRIMLKSYEEKIIAYKRLLLIMALFLLITLFLLPVVVIVYELLFPLVFEQGGDLDRLMVYCIVGFIILQITNYIISIGAMVIRKTKFMLINSVLVLVLHCIGLTMFVPTLGVSGAALSLFLSTILCTVIFLSAIMFNIRSVE